MSVGPARALGLDDSDVPLDEVGQMHGQPLHLPMRPQDLPDRDALAQRWESFSR